LNRVATGEAKGKAWKATVGSQPSHCARWQKENKAEAELYLAELREEARRETVLSLRDKREFLARVVRTPIGDVDEGSDLCQESATEETEIASKKRIKMPDKLRAIELDAKLAGELKEQPPAVTVDAMALLIDQIRNGYKPTE
jgi:hypothetical protein